MELPLLTCITVVETETCYAPVYDEEDEDDYDDDDDDAV